MPSTFKIKKTQQILHLFSNRAIKSIWHTNIIHFFTNIFLEVLSKFSFVFKSFSCNLVFSHLIVNPLLLSFSELWSQICFFVTSHCDKRKRSISLFFNYKGPTYRPYKIAQCCAKCLVLHFCIDLLMYRHTFWTYYIDAEAQYQTSCSISSYFTMHVCSRP